MAKHIPQNFARRVPDEHPQRDLWVHLLEQTNSNRPGAKHSAKWKREHSRRLRARWAEEPPSQTPYRGKRVESTETFE